MRITRCLSRTKGGMLMIRFRNPISDMNVLIENFKKMYVDFSNMDYFDLDNIAEFFAREQLASSSGYIGDEALRRSYLIKDDSRKSMKMQAKSYAELFRFLGWITSGKKALNFNFTYLGLHVALSGGGSKLLFEQCLLGVEYPNHVLNVKFPDQNKPFVNMLLFADELGGKIHRDEILLGAMNLLDGYSQDEKKNKLSYLKKIRESKNLDVLNEEIEKLAKSNDMQANSVRNLTRFVNSALEFSGWFEKKNLRVYEKSSPFLILTEKGKKVVEQIKNSIILKGDSLDVNNPETKTLSELSLLCMFRRADFDVDEEIKKYDSELKRILNKDGKEDIIFSPYQYFSGPELEIILPNNALQTGTEHRTIEVDTSLNLLSVKSEAFVEAKKSKMSKNEQMNKMLLKRIANESGNLSKAIDTFMDDIANMKQTEFYPLVADLIGYVFNRPAFAPSAGNNNMRYDVMIPDDNYSIPVEVKSPTEEEMLSVKAIRQATENKVLLLARKPYKTLFEVSSFACGYKLPNDRSDVYKLIEEIYDTYKINIAILDMNTLIKASFYCAQNKTYYDVSEFIGKRGVIRFENI